MIYRGETHPEEFSEKFEGDIEIAPDQKNAGKHIKKWTKGIVYYDVSQLSSRGKSAVRNALRDLQVAVQSCVRFEERTHQKNYIRVYSGSGCSSFVGMIGRGAQDLSLNEHGCLGMGTIQHEFLHALGFKHEQCRSDRDEYIDIHWQNIDSKMQYNFRKAQTDNLGLGYAYESIMHYGKYAFSSNGKPTLTPKDPRAIIGKRALHKRDIAMVRKLYGCSTTMEKNECDCDYYTGGCRVSKPAPKGLACRCVYKGAWSCSGVVTRCKDHASAKCSQPDKTFESCQNGGGDCEGYPCDCNYRRGGCYISVPPLPGSACKCIYKGAWTCRGHSIACRNSDDEKCKNPDKSYATCEQGRGDCGGY
ncbi:hatching enzyme 1.2-like [Tubulanus polymorphus]|uniref:hatching enzyme 1.2-like n=1 Tax=Tubulanus polymorphus TaxID=672921 RepID=UPI003DA517C0